MAREIPEVVRAVAGLAATVVDETRRLPETLPGLPVRVIGLAMQVSMKLQQHYAGLVTRGDELLTGFRGADEPGLATFDEDEEPAPVAAGGFGTSSFDRVAETVIEVTEDDEVDTGADAVVEEALDELAIEELAESAAGEDGAAALADAVLGADAGTDADGLPESAVLETSPAPAAEDTPEDAAAPSDPGGSPVGEAAGAPDVDTTVDVVTPDGGVATVEAAVTDEGVAAVEGSGESAAPADVPDGGAVSGAATAPGELDTPGIDTGPATAGEPTDEPQGGGEAAGSQAAGAAPVDGYDGWSIAQLRGRLRGYQAVTVTDLIAYEEATRAREPYLRMLRNRLEKLDQQAVEASPLAPRGT
jgi:hypothetical protein